MMPPDPIRPFPTTLDVDADGYPDDTRIQEIRHANDAAGAKDWMLTVFPDLVRSLPCGSVDLFAGTDDFYHPITLIAYSTGGWSGQEELIRAVEHSLCGLFYLWAWRRGGHYEFRIPSNKETL